MHLFSTVAVWQNIFPQSSVLCTLCTGVDRIYGPSSFPPTSSLSPLQQSTHSEPTDKPHLQLPALAAYLCWIREEHHPQTVLQQIFYPGGFGAADRKFLSLFPSCFLLPFIRTGCSHALVNRFPRPRSFLMFQWAKETSLLWKNMAVLKSICFLASLFWYCFHNPNSGLVLNYYYLFSFRKSLHGRLCCRAKQNIISAVPEMSGHVFLWTHVTLFSLGIWALHTHQRPHMLALSFTETSQDAAEWRECDLKQLTSVRK